MCEISLQNILDGFNAPLNEEQAWAICFQVANFLKNGLDTNDHDQFKLTFSELESIFLGKDGNITRISPGLGSAAAKTQSEVVKCIGTVIYKALDFGLGKDEEHALSQELEDLILQMTEGTVDEGDADEGIEDESLQNSSCITLQDVIQLCISHLPTQSHPSSHYKAVCRALVTESLDLTTFLESISANKSRLKSVDIDEKDASEEIQLEQLQRADWARLWMQVVRELRSGRSSLKKVEVYREHHTSFELTPYEALMKDIKDKKYQLKQVMVHGKTEEENGHLPPRTKKDAHNIILEFIRSRPPLHPVRERKFQRSPLEPKVLEPREQLMESIRSEPKLKPTPKSARRMVETSRTKLNAEAGDEAPLPAKRVIKPDATLYRNFSDEDEDSLSGESSGEDGERSVENRNKVEACPLSPITPLSPSPNAAPPPSQWEQTVLHARPKLLSRTTSVSGLRPIIALRPPSLSNSFETNSPSSHNSAPRTSTPSLKLSPLTRSAAFRNTHRKSIAVCESPSYLPDKPSFASRNNSLVRRSASFRAGSNRLEVPCQSPSNHPSSPNTQQATNNGSTDKTNSDDDSSPPSPCPRRPCSLKRAASSAERLPSHLRPVPRALKRSPSCVDSGRSSSTHANKSHQENVPPQGTGSMGRLSLTLEEVMHIRNVLTKAELESLLVRPDLHDMVAKGKVCFTCLKTKFSIFGAWSTKCRMCQRYVCSKCIHKMSVPAERFESIPVYTLCPSHLHNSVSKDDLFICEKTGSAPNSPKNERKSILNRLLAPQDKQENGGSSDISDGIKPRRKVTRSATIRQSPSSAGPRSASVAAQIKGTEMQVCRDCKAMIVNIIKSSRRTVGASALLQAIGSSTTSVSNPCSPLRSPASSSGTLSPSSVKNGSGVERAVSDVGSRPSTRNFRLDLSPVYKG